MIIKGKARTNGLQLGRYLVNIGDNDIPPKILEMNGFIEKSVVEALRNLSVEAEACNRRGGKQGLYHAQVNPGEEMTYEQYLHSVNLLELQLGLSGQRRILVIHQKEGRMHLHAVWSREKNGRFISNSKNYKVHETVSRRLEKEFGHRPASDSLMKEQMEKRNENHREILSELWEKARTGNEFIQNAEKLNYKISVGVGRRPFRVVTPDGQSLDLVRMLKQKNERGQFIKNDLTDKNISIKTKEVREKLQGIKKELPTEAQGIKTRRAEIKEEQDTKQRQREAFTTAQSNFNDVSKKSEIKAEEIKQQTIPANDNLKNEAYIKQSMKGKDYYSDLLKSQQEEMNRLYHARDTDWNKLRDLEKQTGNGTEIFKQEKERILEYYKAKEQSLKEAQEEAKEIYLKNTTIETPEAEKKQEVSNEDDFDARLKRLEERQQKNEVKQEQDEDDDIFARLERKAQQRKGLENGW